MPVRLIGADTKDCQVPDWLQDKSRFQAYSCTCSHEAQEDQGQRCHDQALRASRAAQCRQRMLHKACEAAKGEPQPTERTPGLCSTLTKSRWGLGRSKLSS